MSCGVMVNVKFLLWSVESSMGTVGSCFMCTVYSVVVISYLFGGGV